jgi:capsule biosynthesis phosphatase
MNIIIPLAGNGQRFYEDNYFFPKPLINVIGQSIISLVLKSLKIDQKDKIYIIYKSELNRFNFKDHIHHNLDNDHQIQFIELNTNTRGAAETVFIGSQQILESDHKNEPVLIVDGDTFYTEDIISIFKNSNKNNKNIIFYTKDNTPDPIYSYISLDTDSRLLDIQEKEKISDNACIGAYGFNSIPMMNKAIEQTILSNDKQKNEFYISMIYKKLLKNNIDIYGIEFSSFINLGTPHAVKIFASNFNQNTTKYRFCFDIDNTLLTHPTIKKDYTSVKPISKNIDLVKFLHSQGHTIILNTARRMKTHNGNIGKVQADICKVTLDSLAKYEIPYDEIYFGKPYAHFYIDDLAVNAFDDLEKFFGIYNLHPETRNHNHIDINHNTIIKTSNNIKGEKYYYQNIPNDIVNLFPKLLDHTNKSITIEKINGIPVSAIYTNKILTTKILYSILESINYLHQHKPTTQPINIYANYCEKLENRVQSYDYSIFPNFDNIYNKIFNQLKEYENKNSGIIGMIHGDLVFSNILLDLKDNIKLIDMRGLLGEEQSIYGDILYDYAKIYQSLIGYDFILMNKDLDQIYIQYFIDLFEKYILNKFNQQTLNNIKIITNSLLLSLIPLHNNNKIFEYFKLIHND